MLIEERKIDVDQVRSGMFVCRLDRDWVGTPFLLQGFLVDGDDDIAKLKRYCSHVYIDVQKSDEVARTHLSGAWSRPAKPAASVANTGAQARPARQPAHAHDIDVLAALPEAAEAVERAAEGVVGIFESARSGGVVGKQQADAVVQPIIASLARHPDAFFWLQTLRKHDDYAYAHAVNCSALSVALGRQLGLPEEGLRDLAAGALLLDIGMTKVPAEILSRPGRLSDDERDAVRAHVELGPELYASTGLDDIAVVEVIRGHHERHDGSGYPDRLEGIRIPLNCRIAGLVDSYDAMVTARPYRDALSRHDALQQLYRGRGVTFQEEVVEQFMQVMGIYPVGSLVELNSGEVAIVMAQNRVRRLRPTLMLLTDVDKQLRDNFQPVDLMLADRVGLAEAQLKIVRGLEPGAYGLDPRELYL